MAKTPISDEELQLRKRARRRLVGAIVLVLLVVVLVPMFLEREPRLQKQDMDIRIPPIPGQTQAPSLSGGTQPQAAPPAAAPPEKPETPPQPTSQPAATPPVQTAAPAAAADTTAAEKPPTTTPPRAAAAPAQRPAPQHQSEPATKLPLTPSKELAADEGYVVQLGAFSSAANAKQLLHKLKVEKFPAYTEAVKTTQGERTRVRVGPYPSMEAAEKARDRLKTLKLVLGDARVMRAGE